MSKRDLGLITTEITPLSSGGVFQLFQDKLMKSWKPDVFKSVVFKSACVRQNVPACSIENCRLNQSISLSFLVC